MLKLSRFQDLSKRQNPTPAEEKELQGHIEEFKEKLNKLQSDYGLAITPQISLLPIETPTILTK